MQLDGRIALVTGGGSGIGWATATLLAADGATVVARGPSAGAGLRDHRGLPAGAPTGRAVGLDIASSDAVRLAFVELDRRYRQLDVLVCCAGTSEGAPGETPR